MSNLETIKILELFGGIGAPRAALRNIGVPVKSIDYVEIDEKAVRTYNAMFRKDLEYQTQDVRGWNLKPDILIHGSPCQDFSIAGHQKGAVEGSETRSSLMWETIHIIENMGIWKPRIVIWENVKNVLSRYMIHNFNRYLSEMERMGYKNSFELLDARDFGLPQKRQRVFTVSILGSEPFDFGKLHRRETKPLDDFLEPSFTDRGRLRDDMIPYLVTQPSILRAIGKKGIRRTEIITDTANTITCRQDRSPAQVLSIGKKTYRFLTERECWRLMGFSDEDFDKAAKVIKRNGRFRMPLYKQAGNSMPVPVLEEIFKSLLEEM